MVGGSVTNTYGGGYSGGQGAVDSPYSGGGSYNGGTNQTNTSYTNSATTVTHGFVTITKT